MRSIILDILQKAENKHISEDQFKIISFKVDPIISILDGYIMTNSLFVPIIFLGGVVLFKKITKIRLLSKIKEFKEKANL